jgi:hypothetical protein
MFLLRRLLLRPLKNRILLLGRKPKYFFKFLNLIKIKQNIQVFKKIQMLFSFTLLNQNKFNKTSYLFLKKKLFILDLQNKKTNKKQYNFFYFFCQKLKKRTFKFKKNISCGSNVNEFILNFPVNRHFNFSVKNLTLNSALKNQKYFFNIYNISNFLVLKNF